MAEKKSHVAYSLKDWEGYFAENPRDKIDFVCSEKVFDSYEDARKEAEQRLWERVKQYGKEYDVQTYCDVAPDDADKMKFNEECYLKKLFDENNDELCTLQIVKYEYIF